MDGLRQKWGVVAKAALVVLPLLGAKAVFHRCGIEPIAVGPVITALIAGVFFVIAIMLSGVMPDFKESERIPSELAAAVEALRQDSRLAAPGPEGEAMLAHLRELVRTMLLNFRRQGIWKLTEVNAAVDRIDDDILGFARKGAPPPLLVKLRNEVGNIRRISNRVDVIKETAFLPAGRAIAELASAGALLVLLLAKMESYYEGLLLVGVVSSILVSVVFLIRDIDDPFGGSATVDLRVLQNLEEDLVRRQPAGEGQPPAAG